MRSLGSDATAAEEKQMRISLHLQRCTLDMISSQLHCIWVLLIMWKTNAILVSADHAG